MKKKKCQYWSEKMHSGDWIMPMWHPFKRDIYDATWRCLNRFILALAVKCTITAQCTSLHVPFKWRCTSLLAVLFLFLSISFWLLFDALHYVQCTFYVLFPLISSVQMQSIRIIVTACAVYFNVHLCSI